MKGYMGLLNLSYGNHKTIFLSDFDLKAIDFSLINRQLKNADTHILSLQLDNNLDLLRERLRKQSVDLENDYLSIHALTSTHEGFQMARSLFEESQKGDFTRIELPTKDMGFSPERAETLLKTVASADYQEQDAISSFFFHMLEKQVPYEIRIKRPIRTNY
jgi:hypothetical protein